MRPSGTRGVFGRSDSGGRRPPAITMEPSGLPSTTRVRPPAPGYYHGAIRATKHHSRKAAGPRLFASGRPASQPRGILQFFDADVAEEDLSAIVAVCV
jgi:hypothetical protein